MMQVIIGDEQETEVEPTPQWIRGALRQIGSLQRGSRFLVLMRGDEDQLNALCERDGFTLEWYNGEWGGPHVAYLEGEGRDHQPQRRKGFFLSIFSPTQQILGSRLSLEATATFLDAYVLGANEYLGLRWERLYR
jgi:hypothetical protein